MIIRDTDAVMIVRMMLRERDKRNYLPVMSIKLLQIAKAILGINPHPENKEGLRQWEISTDWPRRLREAGIDPETLELVDLAKWRIAVRAIEQRRELLIAEKGRKTIQEGLREACAKYRPPPAPRPSELIAQHVLAGRIVKELRKEP